MRTVIRCLHSETQLTVSQHQDQDQDSWGAFTHFHRGTFYTDKLLRTVMVLTHRWTPASNPSTRIKKKRLDRRPGPTSPPPPSLALEVNRLWPCPERRQWKAKAAAPKAPRLHRAAAAGAGRVWPQLRLRPPGWFIPADRPLATAESSTISPLRWGQRSCFCFFTTVLKTKYFREAVSNYNLN